MPEPDATPRDPQPNPPPTASGEPARILDVTAVQATSVYPAEATATFAPAPGAEQLATATAGALDDTDADPTSHLPQITGYRVLRVISGGGMGTVFKAVHLGLNKVMALKLINSGWAADSDFRVRFDREAKTLAQLEHPNIVPVYDAGSWQGLPYLAMKYIAGKTLYHRMEALRGNLPAACHVMAQVARAVHYLHTQNIVHRDLKPLNILMTTEGVPLVADFGLVRPIGGDSECSFTFMPLGTRPYMSPEQTRGGRENYTAACDIWAIGVILYELLAGTRPFANDDYEELFRRIRYDAVPPMPPELGVPPGLEVIANRCLQKAPADRYATAEAVATDLERWLAGEQIEAITVTPAQPGAAPTASERKPQRSRAPLAGVAVILAMLVAGAALHDWRPAPKPAVEPAQKEAVPPVVEKPIAERLRAGETVWLVGDKGLPRVKYRTLPGTHGAPTTEHDGYLTLTSAGMLALELETGPLPDRVQLVAEVGLILSNQNWSWGGVYAGHKETPSEQGLQQSILQLVQQNSYERDGEVVIVTEKVSLELHRWVDRAPHDRTDSGSKSLITRVPVNVKQKDSVAWHKFDLVIDPSHVAGRWRDEPVSSLAHDRVLSLLRGTYGKAHPKSPMPFQPSAFGAGLGLTVRDATAVFRNVRLIPLNP